MNFYNDYLKEIEERKTQGLHPKPIDSAELVSEIIEQIKSHKGVFLIVVESLGLKKNKSDARGSLFSRSL